MKEKLPLYTLKIVMKSPMFKKLITKTNCFQGGLPFVYALFFLRIALTFIIVKNTVK